MCGSMDHMKELIKTGHRRDGLYYFSGGDLASTVYVNAASSNLELWHRRMGHPSDKVVKLLPPICGHKGSMNEACKICFHAKHARDRFPISQQDLPWSHIDHRPALLRWSQRHYCSQGRGAQRRFIIMPTRDATTIMAFDPKFPSSVF